MTSEVLGKLLFWATKCLLMLIQLRWLYILEKSFPQYFCNWSTVQYWGQERGLVDIKCSPQKCFPQLMKQSQTIQHGKTLQFSTSRLLQKSKKCYGWIIICLENGFWCTCSGCWKILNIQNLHPHTILLLDYAPSHPSELKLKKNEIKTIFLPAVAPPHIIIQLIYQGVIEWLRRYRRKYVSALLVKAGKGRDIFEAMPQH